MKKAAVITYGCQMNVNESAKIKNIFKNLGYDITENIDEANAIFFKHLYSQRRSSYSNFWKIRRTKTHQRKK